jgi:Tol biopolymer transport system component
MTHALLAIVAVTAATGWSQSGPGVASAQYAPAYYNGTLGEPHQLVVFPRAGKQVVIPLALPTLLRFMAFTSDGRTISATINTTATPRTPGHPGRLGPPRLIRVDLAPVRVTTVADLVGLGDVLGMVLAPRQDKILFLGAGWKGNMDCDLFQIDPSGGEFKMLLPNFGCRLGGISPDGSKMIIRDDFSLGLAIVDLATGDTVQLGTRLWKAAWSPDGRWIAALHIDPPGEGPPGRISWTVLIDAHDFSKQRDMGGKGDTEVSWSPDSRYLLYSESQPSFCSHGVTLFTMDIESGKRVIVKESKCNVNSSRRIGWVSLDVMREAGAGATP